MFALMITALVLAILSMFDIGQAAQADSDYTMQIVNDWRKPYISSIQVVDKAASCSGGMEIFTYEW